MLLTRIPETNDGREATQLIGATSMASQQQKQQKQ